MDIGRFGCTIWGGTLLTWELDCRWGKEKVEEKGMTGQVEETLEAGEESTQRRK